MSSRANLRQYNCQYCKRRSIMIIYNHEQTCARNPNRAYNIARRYGGRHVSGADLSLIISRRRLAAGLERPAASPTPSILSVIGSDIQHDAPLPRLDPTDVEAALTPVADQAASGSSGLTVQVHPVTTAPVDPTSIGTAASTPPDIVAVSLQAAGVLPLK